MAYVTDSLLKTESEIIESLGRTLPPGKAVTADTNIVRDLNLDSLAVMDFMFSLEAQFDVMIPLDALADVQTVRELAVVIAELREPANRTASA